MFLLLSTSSNFSNDTKYSISVPSLQHNSIFIGNLNSWLVVSSAVSFISLCCMKEYLDYDENVTGWLVLLALFVLFWDAGTGIFQPTGLRCRCGKPSCVCFTSVFQHRYLHLNPITANNDSHQTLPKTHNPQGQQGIVGDLITGWGSCRRRQVVLLCETLTFWERLTFRTHLHKDKA